MDRPTSRSYYQFQNDRSISIIIALIYYLFYLGFLVVQIVRLSDLQSSMYSYLVVLVYLRTILILNKISSFDLYVLSYSNFDSHQIGVERVSDMIARLKRNKKCQKQRQQLAWIQKLFYLDKLKHQNGNVTASTRKTSKSSDQYSRINIDKLTLRFGDSFQQKIDETIVPKKVVQYFSEYSDQLDFNPFKVQKMSNQNGLQYYLHYVFEQNDLIATLNIDKQKFANMVLEIQKNYLDNIYHNSTHAMDVTQTMNFFLKRCEFEKLANMNAIQISSCYLACAAHDINHPGFNNLFYTNTQNPLSILYNDKAVLENYHCSFYFNMLQKPEYCILEEMSTENQKEFRSLVVGMILATDMSIHFSDLEVLKKKQENGQQLELQEPKQRQDCLNYLTHAADISNPIKNIEIYGKWADLVIQEFFQQGDKEKELGLMVSYLCDRETTKLPQSQIGFIDFVVLPLFSQIKLFVPGVEKYMDNFEVNKKYYELMIIKQKCQEERQNQDKNQEIDVI